MVVGKYCFDFFLKAIILEVCSIKLQSMKKITFLLITLFFYSSIGAQTNKQAEQYPVNNKKSYYLGSLDITEISIGASFDTLAKVRSYANKFPNINNKALTYIQNGNRLQFDINCKQLSSIKDYRFVVTDDQKNDILSGSLDELTFTKLPFYGYSAYGYSAKLPILDIQNKVISITLYNSKDPAQQGTAIVYNQTLPQSEIIFVNKEVFTNERKGDVSKVTFDQKSKGILIAAKKNDYSFIYALIVKEKKTGKTVFKDQSWDYSFISSEGGGSQPNISIDKNYFKNSGDYEIIIRPDLKHISEKELAQYSSRKTISVEFVKTYTTGDFFLWSIILIVICFCIAASLFYLIRRKNKQKIKDENLKKKISEAKLASIQSQLNPHFLFNALSSIQSFINDHDVDNANRYLSKFARLTRHVLNSPASNILTDEQNLLTDYLMMEQLRFGFRYEIQRNSLEGDNIEIPTMLLQPLVENAVKHGIAELRDRGEIKIYFDRKENDMLVTIIDNGTGYDVDTTIIGLGIRLTNERIQIWNELHPQELISLATVSNSTGTYVYLTFKNWL